MEHVMRKTTLVKKVIFKVPYGGWVSAEPTKKSIGYFVIDIPNKTVGYTHYSGTTPTAEMLLYSLMADKDVYRLAKEYCNNGARKNPFEIKCRTGMSGCEDYSICWYKHFGDVNVKAGCRHLLHISGCGKVNEDIRPMWIGDLVEVFKALMEPSVPFNRKVIRDRLKTGFNFKYIYEAEHGEITTVCSNIFE